MDQNSSQKTALPISSPVAIVISLVGLLWLAVFAFQIMYRPASSAAPLISPGTRFFFSNYSFPEWYTVNGTNVSRASGPAGFDHFPSVVVEAGTSVATGTPVLVSETGDSGTVFGVAHADGSFTPLDTGKTQKENLVSNNAGVAVFSEYVGGAWTLMTVDVNAPAAPHSLGAGFLARFTGDGTTLVAVAPEGLVRIDPSTGRRVVLAPYAPLLQGSFAVSDGATFAVFMNAVTHKLDVFSLNPYGGNVSYEGSIPGAPFGFAFVGSHLLAERFGTTTVAVYDALEKGIPEVVDLPIVPPPPSP